MKFTKKYGACLPVFGSCADRFCVSGYGGGADTLEGMFDLAATVEGLKGIELIGNWHINSENMLKIKGILQDKNLQVSMVTPDLWTQAKWKRGSFAAPDAQTRKSAVAEVKKTMDWAAELGCPYVDVWLGQDGYDYCFQADFEAAWENIVASVRECASYRRDVKILIEYKAKEPRAHIFIARAANVKLLVQEVGCENVGALLDVGHSLSANENVAEAIALLNTGKDKMLDYVHFNDNWRTWDDDMMFGSVHLVESLELLYWLERTGYSGWYTLDIFPYREDGVKAAQESIAWIEGLLQVLEKIGYNRIDEVIQKADAIEVSRMMREVLLPQLIEKG